MNHFDHQKGTRISTQMQNWPGQLFLSMPLPITHFCGAHMLILGSYRNMWLRRGLGCPGTLNNFSFGGVGFNSKIKAFLSWFVADAKKTIATTVPHGTRKAGIGRQGQGTQLATPNLQSFQVFELINKLSGYILFPFFYWVQLAFVFQLWILPGFKSYFIFAKQFIWQIKRSIFICFTTPWFFSPETNQPKEPTIFHLGLQVIK